MIELSPEWMSCDPINLSWCGRPGDRHTIDKKCRSIPPETIGEVQAEDFTPGRMDEIATKFRRGNNFLDIEPHKIQPNDIMEKLTYERI